MDPLPVTTQDRGDLGGLPQPMKGWRARLGGTETPQWLA